MATDKCEKVEASVSVSETSQCRNRSELALTIGDIHTVTLGPSFVILNHDIFRVISKNDWWEQIRQAQLPPEDFAPHAEGS